MDIEEIGMINEELAPTVGFPGLLSPSPFPYRHL